MRGRFCPRDWVLGLHGTSLSPAATRMVVGEVAAMVSFGESSELLRELAGLGVAAKQVERTAEAPGGVIVAHERAVVEPAAPAAPHGVSGHGFQLVAEVRPAWQCIFGTRAADHVGAA